MSGYSGRCGWIVVYIDMVFLVNYTMDFILLIIADGFMKNHAGYGRIALAALTGALWACVAETGLVADALMRDIFTYGAVSLLMALICIKRQGDKKRYFKRVMAAAFTYIITASIAGGIAGLIYYNTAAGYVLRTMALDSRWLFVCLLGTMLLMAVILRNYLADRTYDGSLCDVSIDFGAFTINTKGIIDTGNVLVDNIIRKPVHIIDKACADRCVNMDIVEYCCMYGKHINKTSVNKSCGNDNGLGMHYVMFSSVGKQNGCMPVIMAARLSVSSEDREVVLENVPIGLSYTPLSADGIYEVLLNAEIRHAK